MGRRKQHCPKRTNDGSSEDGMSEANDLAMEDQKDVNPSPPRTPSQESIHDLAQLMHAQRAQTLALQAQIEEQQRRVRSSLEMKDLPLDLSASIRSFIQSKRSEVFGQSVKPPPTSSSTLFSDQLKRQLGLPGLSPDLLLRFPMPHQIIPNPLGPFIPDLRHRLPPGEHHVALSTLQRMSEMARMQRTKQMYWPNKAPPISPDCAAEVFSCVWCQERYSSLPELTQHLKEAKHSSVQPPSKSDIAGPLEEKSSIKQSNKDASSPMPRKLVRGQDVWLGKGQEQTRQILKCMWCGESFKSLAELTSHMQETQHYTKVISQEQLSSWRNDHGSTRDDDIGSVPPKISSKKQDAKPISVVMPKDNQPVRSSKDFGDDKKKVVRKRSLPVRKLLELERQSETKEQEESRDGDDEDTPERETETVDDSGAAAAGSILGSLEKMVESSFFSARSDRRPEVVAGILQKIGVDEVRKEDNLELQKLFHQRLDPQMASTLFKQFIQTSPAKLLQDLKASRADDDNDPVAETEVVTEAVTEPTKRKGEDNEDLASDSSLSIPIKRVKSTPSDSKSTLRKDFGSDVGRGESENKFFKYVEMARQLSSR